MKSKLSPYLAHEGRLADIIAAIQVMGTYPKFASREPQKWEDKLDKPISAASWAEICNEHPEFFRLRESNGSDRRWASLRWRWALDEDYDPDEGRSLSLDEIRRLTEQQRRKLTRAPLESSQIETLIDTAISLHTRAIEYERQKQWWVPVVIPAITALIGAGLGFVGAWLGK
jgi:hypothetical protein